MTCNSAIAVLITILVSACASYQAKPLAPPLPEAMPHSYSDTYVNFHADPCVNFDRQMELFDADLTKMGVIPIEVFVSSKSDRLFTLPPAYTWLELSDGTKIPRAYLSEFFKQLEEPKEEPKEPPEPKQSPEEEPSFASQLGRAALQGAVRGVFEGALPLIVMGAVLSSPVWGTAWYLHHRSEQAWTQRLSDYDSKEQPLFLDKDESGHGFMFFIPPLGTRDFDEATLNVSITEPDETPISLFHIELKGLEFKGTKAAQN